MTPTTQLNIRLFHFYKTRKTEHTNLDFPRLILRNVKSLIRSIQLMSSKSLTK